MVISIFTCEINSHIYINLKFTYTLKQFKHVGNEHNTDRHGNLHSCKSRQKAVVATIVFIDRLHTIKI